MDAGLVSSSCSDVGGLLVVAVRADEERVGAGPARSAHDALDVGLAVVVPCRLSPFFVAVGTGLAAVPAGVRPGLPSVAEKVGGVAACVVGGGRFGQTGAAVPLASVAVGRAKKVMSLFCGPIFAPYFCSRASATVLISPVDFWKVAQKSAGGTT